MLENSLLCSKNIDRKRHDNSSPFSSSVVSRSPKSSRFKYSTKYRVNSDRNARELAALLQKHRPETARQFQPLQQQRRIPIAEILPFQILHEIQGKFRSECSRTRCSAPKTSTGNGTTIPAPSAAASYPDRRNPPVSNTPRNTG